MPIFLFHFFNKKEQKPLIQLFCVSALSYDIYYSQLLALVLMVHAVIISHKFTELKKSISILVHGIRQLSQQIYREEIERHRMVSEMAQKEGR